jgi:hypothetical protein
MKDWLLLGLSILLFIGWTVKINLDLNRAQRAVAAQRDPVSTETFFAALQQTGLSQSAVEVLTRGIAIYYRAPLTPHPDDRPDDPFLKIDREDVADMLNDAWIAQGLPRINPIIIPEGLSWRGLAAWLASQSDASGDAS